MFYKIIPKAYREQPFNKAFNMATHDNPKSEFRSIKHSIH